MGVPFSLGRCVIDTGRDSLYEDVSNLQVVGVLTCVQSKPDSCCSEVVFRDAHETWSSDSEWPSLKETQGKNGMKGTGASIQAFAVHALAAAPCTVCRA